jgi:Zn-dependent peptidase ImmA (M78 family)/DNA-binding XRE family transcriptional regulator
VNEAFITPEVARWARERSGVSEDALAAALHVSPEQVVSWESGEAFPPFPKAQDLARTLRVPFGFLFLSRPPAVVTPIPDLRTIQEGEPHTPSPDFLDLLNDVLIKRDWYREYLEESRAKKPDVVGRFQPNDGVDRVAADLAKSLAVGQLRAQSNTWDDYLRGFVRNAEANGILVMRSGIVGGNTRRKLSVSEFRGFAICDELAPLVFINGRDARAAQIFTLAHELAHIWIGESGISNPDPRRTPEEQKNAIERFCNAVAAEVLVPATDVGRVWPAAPPNEQDLQRLAARYRVSVMVILRRGYEVGKLGRDDFFTLVAEEQERQKKREARRTKDSGGNFYATLPARNSVRLTDTVLGALQEGRVMYRDAARLLGVKVSTLPKLTEGRNRR